jgi:tetratricopeptide (TPR) repeat protein
MKRPSASIALSPRAPRRAARWLLAATLATSVGCASMNARSAWQRGQKAEQQGDLAGAIREYGVAADAAPKETKYQDALSRARRAGAEAHVNAARAAEAQGDFEAAGERWKSARAFLPSAEYEARQRLAEIRASRVDPLELFQATQKLVDALPGDRDALGALEQARTDAFRYYAKLGETMFDAGNWEEAFGAFEKARKVKPDDELAKSIKFRVAHARSLEAAGDRQLKVGDALAAFESYTKAQGLAEIPGLAQKLERARKSAGNVVEQLEQARAAERLKKWEDAAELYTLLRERKDAPAEVADAAARTRKESARLRAERAIAFAGEARADQAVAQLALAVEHTDAAEVALARLRSAVEALQTGQISQAIDKLGAAEQAAASLAAVGAGRPVALAKARAELEAARVIGASDPAEAMVRLRRLDALKAELPQYEATWASLKKRAFQALVERAEAQSKEGRAKEATESLRTAASIATLPPALDAPVKRGLEGLVEADFERATESFADAVAKDPKSRLAKAGQTVARWGWLRALRAEAEAAERAEDPLRAAQAYRRVLDLVPDDQTTRDSLDALRPELLGRAIAAARGARDAGKAGSAYVYVRRALDLDPNNGEASELLTSLMGRFELRDAPVAYVAPVLRGRMLGDACPGAEVQLRERAILYLTRTRGLGADFLQAEPHREIDAGKRDRPSVELVSALESCAVNTAGGRTQMSTQLRIGGKVVVEEPLGVSFDPATLPKDERADGITEAKVFDAVLRETAKLMTRIPERAADALREWRAAWATGRLEAKDDEGIARAFATLSLRKDKLTPRERQVLGELTRYVETKLR